MSTRQDLYNASQMIVTPTEPYPDQKPGTSGLRKTVAVFSQPNYVENFAQSILDAQPETPKLLVIGGDGRYYSREAIIAIIRVCVANKVPRLIVALNGLLSTPAASALIRKRKADGGIILTASHNMGGVNGDFGIKFNTANGGPAPESVTDKIYEISKSLKQYRICPAKMPLKLNNLGLYAVWGCMIDVVDPIDEYMELLQEVFDFDLLKKFMREKRIHMIADAMGGVTGPYVYRILHEEFNISPSDFLHYKPQPDFNGNHPDPNLTHAEKLVTTMQEHEKYEFGVAFDGDGDRNMILGQKAYFVSPGDSLAVIAHNINSIKYFKEHPCPGFARSFPTSCAVDEVAKKSRRLVYETPTGWKFFGNLMESGKISLCGEESFGTGSDHIREKDGLWACLAWLTIIATTGMSVKQLVENLWDTYGVRHYFCRYDFENCDKEQCDIMFDKLNEKLTDSSKPIERLTQFGDYSVDSTGNFEYRDPVDGSLTTNQGLYLKFVDGHRIIFRMSGTGSSGATVRLYLHKPSKTDFHRDSQEFTQDLLKIAYDISELPKYLGTDKPTVITT